MAQKKSAMPLRKRSVCLEFLVWRACLLGRTAGYTYHRTGAIERKIRLHNTIPAQGLGHNKHANCRLPGSL
jgi:hypothetical protein